MKKTLTFLSLTLFAVLPFALQAQESIILAPFFQEGKSTTYEVGFLNNSRIEIIMDDDFAEAAGMTEDDMLYHVVQDINYLLILATGESDGIFMPMDVYFNQLHFIQRQTGEPDFEYRANGSVLSFGTEIDLEDLGIDIESFEAPEDLEEWVVGEFSGVVEKLDFYMVFPDEGISIGDSFEVDERIVFPLDENFVFQVLIKYVFTLEGISDNLATFAIEVVTRLDDGFEFDSVMVDGGGEGKMVYNWVSGEVVSKSESFEIDIDVDQDFFDLEIEMKVQSEMRLVAKVD